MGRRGTRPALVLAVAAALLSVPVAQATPPTIVPAPSFDFTDTTSCGFDVHIHYTANHETAKIFSNGTIIVTGPLAATFSADNGKSVTLNIRGPATIKGESAIGHGVGAGLTLLPDGQTTLAYNAAGAVDISGPVGVLVHGHMLLDICAALAS
ncbi:MAG: hypothetical protein ACRDM1_02930 [Gaiellaceae bacterium]